MATGTIESAAFSLPTIPLGAQIAVDEVNAAGGINGRPLELVVCNDELDPNKASACVQQAVQDGVVALVGGLSVFEPIVFPLLQTSGIPWVGASTSTDFSTPILFPVGADGATAFSAIGAAAIETGCKNPAVLISASGSPANTAAIRAGIEVAGGTVAVELQTNGPDLAPLIESALAANADCIASGVSPAESGALVAAVQGRLPIVTLDGSLPEGLAAALGSAADGIHVVSGFRLPAAGDPATVALAEKSLAINPEAPMDHFWITGYSSVKIVAEALSKADDVSSEVSPQWTLWHHGVRHRVRSRHRLLHAKPGQGFRASVQYRDAALGDQGRQVLARPGCSAGNAASDRTTGQVAHITSTRGICRCGTFRAGECRRCRYR